MKKRLFKTQPMENTLHFDVNIEEVASNEIAIIGMAAKLPMADQTADFWPILQAGKCCVREISEARKKDVERFLRHIQFGDTENLAYFKMAYLEEIDKFDYGFFNLSPKEASLMDPNQRLFLETAWATLEDAGYGGDALYGSRTGVYLGFGTTSTNEYKNLIFQALPPETMVNAFTGNINPMIASRISYVLNLKGPVLTIDTACSSSLVALHTASQAIRNGECEQAIVGGININLLPVDRFIRVGIESTDGKTRTFDDDSLGTGSGEGVIAFLLKPLRKALEDRDSIYAIIKGSALNHDGRSNGITAPNPAAQAEVIELACANAGISPATLSYIEAHGTGTRLGDPIEITGISRALEKYTTQKMFCGVGSVKSNIGHLNYAAGAAGVLKMILALKHQQLPPTIQISRPNREINFVESPTYILNELTQWKRGEYPRRSGISGFAMSGTNCHIILEEAPLVPDHALQESGEKVLTLSAQTAEALQELVIRYAKFCRKAGELNLAHLTFTASVGRGHYSHRLAVVVKDWVDLQHKLDELCYAEWPLLSHLPDVYFGEHKLLTEKKQTLLPGELTAAQKRELSKRAAEEVATWKKSAGSAPDKLCEICQLYVAGADVQWGEFYPAEERRRLHLPTYPFAKKRCWLDIPEAAPEKVTELVENQFYDLSFEVSGPIKSRAFPATGDLLIFADQQGYLANQLAQQLSGHRRVIQVEQGEKYQKLSPDRYTISGGEADYQRLLSEIDIQRLTQIVHLTNAGECGAVDSLEGLEQRLTESVYSLYYLTRALKSHTLKGQLDILLVGKHVHQITGGEKLQPETATLFGLGKVVRVENPELRCRTLDLDESLQVEQILEELELAETSYTVAYRNGTRYVQVLQEKEDKPQTKMAIKPNGVYILTGGLGKIGLKLGLALTLQAKITLVMINRTPLPAREHWGQLLVEGTDEKLVQKLQAILEMERKGSKVICYSADVSKEEEISPILQELRATYGQINGVIHLPIVKELDFLYKQEVNAFRSALLPKVHGAWVMDRLTREDHLDFYLLFSSVITLMGGFGVGAIVSAHSYLDALGEYRNQLGARTTVIKWPIWKEIVEMYKEELADNNQIFKAVTTAEGLEIFQTILEKGWPGVIVGQLNHQQENLLNEEQILFKVASDLTEKIKKQRKLPLEPVHDKEPARKALPQVKLNGKEAGSYTQTEITVAQIWAEALGYEEINIFDNFYELGGDSILANRIINNLSKQLEIQLNIIEIFKYQTIFTLSEYLDQKKGQAETIYALIEPVAEQEHYELSSAQKRFFILNQLNPNSTNYNMPNLMQVEGALELQQVEKVFQELIKRHEGLRTSFHFRQGLPVQVVHPEVEFTMGRVETESGAADLEQTIRTLVQPFELQQAPLVRATVIRLAEQRHLLFFDMHHIISDAVSMSILIQDFIALYQHQQLPPIRIQYKDFAAWQNALYISEAFKKQEEFWLDQFAGEIPVLNLPTDLPRPEYQSFEGNVVDFAADAQLTAKLNQLSVENGATLFMTLLAAYYVLLAKYTGQEDLVVGSLIIGRPHVDLEQIIGLFMNTLALRNNPRGELSFKEFLQNVKEGALQAYENQDYPYEELVDRLKVKRDFSRNPLFDTMFLLQNVDMPEIAFENLRFTPYGHNNHNVKLDLIVEVREYENQIYFELKYCTKLFKHSTIEQFTRHYANLLRNLVEHPEEKLGQVEMLSPAEKSLMLAEWNATTKEMPLEKTVYQLFFEQVARWPEKTALVWGQEKLTYREVHEKVSQVARQLLMLGVGEEQVVGIIAGPSLEMVLGLLATLKIGAAYLPINPDFPAERIRYMLSDSQTSVLLVDASVASLGEFPEVQTIRIDQQELVSGQSTWAPGLGEGPTCTNPRNLAYVIYTSGTTGQPKGVLLEHRGLVNYVCWFKDLVNLEPGDRTVLLSSFAFDLGYTALYPALLSGAELHLVDRELYSDPEKLLTYLQVNQISYFKATPSLFNMLVNTYSFEEKGFANSLRLVVLGGEAINVQDLEKLQRINPEVQVLNHYGPTETTIGTIAQFVNLADLSDYKLHPTIGRPVANQQVYLLDRHMRPVARGVQGEIYIGGVGLARGYLNQPELTAARFFPNPFATDAGYLYKTGDLGRYLPDGRIEFIGRIDHQVKIRGYRVELGEIERHLLDHELIQEVTILVKVDALGGKFLVAYFIAKTELTVAELRSYLNKRLPEYMIPTCFRQIDHMPLTPNGKIDTAALPDLTAEVNSGVELVLPVTEAEQKMQLIWQEILGIAKIGLHDNFFTLGGNSLKATYLVSRVHKVFQVEIPLRTVFYTATLEEFTEAVVQAERKDFAEIPRLEKQESYPVSSAQKRMFVLDQFAGIGTSYNVFTALQIVGKLEVARVENAFKELIARHEVLRSSFALVDEVPVQIVHDEVNFALEYAELAAGDVHRKTQEFIRKFDLSQAPLLRAGVFRVSPETHYLLVDMHHIISDGTSRSILLREFIELYQGHTLPELRVQYKEFSAWQNALLTTGKLKAQEEYWLEVFAQEKPVLKMPLDFPRPAMQSFQGNLLEFKIDRELTSGLKELAATHEGTLFMVLMALYNVLLYKYTDEEDIVVGSPISGRRHVDLDNVIGMFVNTLALRNYPRGEASFSEFFHSVAENALKAFDNQDYQFEKIVEKIQGVRDISRNPLFDTMFILHNTTEPKIELAELSFIPVNNDGGFSKFDFSLFAREVDGELWMIFEYCTELFKRETIERMARNYQRIIAAVVENPEIKLADVQLEKDFIAIEVDEMDDLDFAF